MRVLRVRVYACIACMRNNYNLINISNIKYHEFFYPLLIQKILNGTKKIYNSSLKNYGEELHIKIVVVQFRIFIISK